MAELNIHVTNPAQKVDYGVMTIEELIEALSNPLEHEKMTTAVRIKYDYSANELEFKMVSDDIRELLISYELKMRSCTDEQAETMVDSYLT